MIVEKFLYEASILDGMGNMDGSFVPIGVAMAAVQQALNGELEMIAPSWMYNHIWYGLSTGTKAEMLARRERIHSK